MFLKSFLFFILFIDDALAITNKEVNIQGYDMIVIGFICIMFALGWIAGSQR